MTKPRRPTKHQREIAARFKAGESVCRLWIDCVKKPGIRGITEIEDALRICLIWESRGER